MQDFGIDYRYDNDYVGSLLGYRLDSLNLTWFQLNICNFKTRVTMVEFAKDRPQKIREVFFFRSATPNTKHATLLRTVDP